MPKAMGVKLALNPIHNCMKRSYGVLTLMWQSLQNPCPAVPPSLSRCSCALLSRLQPVFLWGLWGLCLNTQRLLDPEKIWFHFTSSHSVLLASVSRCMCLCHVVNESNWFAPLLLLLQTICQKTPKDSAPYEECKRALQEVSKVCRLKMFHTVVLDVTRTSYTPSACSCIISLHVAVGPLTCAWYVIAIQST